MGLAGTGRMQHFVLRAREGTLLWHTWREAAALWQRVAAAAPGAAAICVMPDHVHVLHPRDIRAPLLGAARRYARWRNTRRGERGAVFRPLGAAVIAAGAVKRRRDERYIHLNPCRAGLVSDPLAWPFSTHRDAVGLAVGAARPAAPDPVAYHRYVSGDPHVAVSGTELPEVTPWVGASEAALVRVEAAVSALTRTPAPGLRRRGPARTLLIRAARTLTTASAPEIAAFVGVTARTVHKTARHYDHAVALVDRVLGDPRFRGLGPEDLRRGWRRYMARHGIRG